MSAYCIESNYIGAEPSTDYGSDIWPSRLIDRIERFLNFAVFGILADLRNRTLHIRWDEFLNDVMYGAKRQNDVLKTSSTYQCKLSLKKMAVVQLMLENPSIAISQTASRTQMSKRTVDRIINSLKERRIVTRLGAKNKIPTPGLPMIKFDMNNFCPCF